MNKIGGFYGVLPAIIRRSEISFEAMVIYSEITALSYTDGYCYASNAYIAEIYKKSERSISRWISELESHGFVSVEVVKNQDGTHRKVIPLVRIDSPVVPVSQSCHSEDSPVVSNKRKKYNIKKEEKNKKVFPVDSDQYKVAKGYYLLIKKHNKEIKEPNLQAWCRDVDLMIRIDKYTVPEICGKMRAVQADDFWRNNILSPAKLRQKWKEGKLSKLIPIDYKGDLMTDEPQSDDDDEYSHYGDVAYNGKRWGEQ